MKNTVFLLAHFQLLCALSSFGMHDEKNHHDLPRLLKLQDYVLLSDGTGHMRVTFNPADRSAYLTNYSNEGKQRGSKTILMGNLDLTNFKSLGMVPVSVKEVLLVFLASKNEEDNICIFTRFHRIEGFKKNFILKTEGKIVSLLSVKDSEKKFYFKILEKTNDAYNEFEVAVNHNLDYGVTTIKYLKEYYPVNKS